MFSWMNNDYFKLVLTKFEGHDNLQISAFDVSLGTNKGENYASAIYRVNISYLLKGEPKEATFILKANPVSSAMSEMLEEMGTFKGETHIYENVITECEKMLSNFKIAPRLIHVDNNALVFEDLTQLDTKYTLASRKNRFDLPKAKLVLEKVAKFHAATAVIHEKNAKLMELHQNSVIDSDETPLTFFFAVSLQETLETIGEIPELQQLLPILENYDIVERERQVFSRCAEDKFHVLNHGDLWINNIFFSSTDNGEPVDTILVDYQECFWGSPGIDLNHFLYTSCDLNVLENHVDDLIRFYYHHLRGALENLLMKDDTCSLKIPTLEDIQEEFQRKRDQGLIVLCSVVPVMMIENPEHANPENFITDGEEAAKIRREVYGNPEFVEILKVLLPKFADKRAD